MKFFLDENIPISTTEVFTNLGFEVEHCKNSKLRGSSDRLIAEYCKEKCFLQPDNYKINFYKIPQLLV